MSVKKKLAKGMLFVAVAGALSPLMVSMAAQPTTQQQEVRSFHKLSEQGQHAFADINAARAALYDGHTKEALQRIRGAQLALKEAKSDDAAFMRAEADLIPSHEAKQGTAANEPAKAWLPVWGDIVTTDDYTASPEKMNAVTAANAKLKKGDAKGALETLRLSGVNVDATTAVVPLQDTIHAVDEAAALLAADKFYEANLVLKHVQDSVRYDIVAAELTPERSSVHSTSSPSTAVAPKGK